ncbi:MAG: threonine--tRNA ligase [Candidatus Micrarchaeia archaeon]
MKILQLDVNSIKYKLIEPESKVFEKSDIKEKEIDDALVLLVSIEKGDTEQTAKEAIDNALNFMKQTKRNKLVIYPFAHLSNNLEEPQKALAILEKMREDVPKNIELVSAPFGWNKSLSLDIKGHPLAEQSKTYGSVSEKKEQDAKKEGLLKQEEEALKQEDKVISTWYILDEHGKLVSVKDFDFAGHENLKKFASYEMSKVRAYQQVPAHVKLMRRLELVDYESGSDSGNMRYYPNGRLIKSLLEQYVTKKVIEYGAVELETPIMYDYGHPALKEYLRRFPARHYIVKSDDKDFFLRFSADFGQFLIMHDATISYKQLPFKFYELTRYSFRREKSGEVMGLKRLRSFTMPDMHTLCTDLEQAKAEFKNQFKFSQEILSGIGIGYEKYEAAIRFTKGFWEENEDFIKSIVKDMLKKPALIEMWDFRYAYFDPKFEFNIIDTMDKATALSTVQVDHENGKRYDIAYVDKEGKKEYPILLHCSPSGAIERVIYALLEFAAIDEKKGIVPSLPLWISPIQARLLPISDKHVEKCIEMAKKLKGMGIRVDVDDTANTLDKKVLNAEQSWIPYICIVGDKEISSNKLSVRFRSEKNKKEISMNELAEEINRKCEGMPKSDNSLPMLLSKRPTFVG